jgi:hypothetical protein
MRHARKDYAEIQDPRGKIPADEPVFVLRAQDVTAPGIVEAWGREVAAAGGDPLLAVYAVAWADEMRRWQLEHGAKVPDVDRADLDLALPASEVLGGPKTRDCAHDLPTFPVHVGRYEVRICSRCGGAEIAPPLPNAEWTLESERAAPGRMTFRLIEPPKPPRLIAISVGESVI